MNKELPKVYEPQQVESRIYQMWMDGDCFNGDPDPKKKPFSISMPPPNERITLNGQPELATILFIAGGYVQQIRLFLKRKIYLCLIVLDAQNQVDDLLFVFFLICDNLNRHPVTTTFRL